MVSAISRPSLSSSADLTCMALPKGKKKSCSKQHHANSTNAVLAVKTLIGRIHASKWHLLLVSPVGVPVLTSVSAAVAADD